MSKPQRPQTPDRLNGSRRLGPAQPPARAEPDGRAGLDARAEPNGQAGLNGRAGLDARAELGPRVRGAVLLPGDDGYDEARAGYNLALVHRPAVLVEAAGTADVMAAVAFATDHGMPVGAFNTGHGVSVPSDGAMLIGTRRIGGIQVDPFARTARIGAGVTWEEVIHETAPFGLAPLNGSAPAVGAIGYLLGGGLSVLGRTFGYAADHVRSIDVVTAHGALRTATPGQFSDLFWALRGGKGNFGVVTSAEIGLFPVPALYGGGLMFRGSSTERVLNAYRRWVRTMPDEMSSSIALIRFPWREDFPETLRGRFVVHVRIAYVGAAADGERLIRPLRDAAVPLLDTVAEMPYRAIGTIHNDPVEPAAMHGRCVYLSELDEDTVDALSEVAGPDTTCPLRVVELRHLGGALSRPPEQPNAVGNRDAAFLLYVVGEVGYGDDPLMHQYAERLIGTMAPWSTGRSCVNFIGEADATPERVRAAYAPEDYDRLARIKRSYDPENIFRITHNIPPFTPPAVIGRRVPGGQRDGSGQHGSGQHNGGGSRRGGNGQHEEAPPREDPAGAICVP